MKPLLAVLLIAGLPVWAEEKSLTLAPDKTEVDFKVGSTLHTVHGTFKLKRGSLHLDSATGDAGGEIVVDASSGSSGGDSRDSRMAKVVLEADKYPDIIFVPKHIDGAINPSAESRVVIKGSFRLHGVDHDIEGPVDVKFSGNDVTAVMNFPVPYVKWGLKDPSNFVLKVDKVVLIEVHVTGRLESK